jgi:hypothetical protein
MAMNINLTPQLEQLVREKVSRGVIPPRMRWFEKLCVRWRSKTNCGL